MTLDDILAIAQRRKEELAGTMPSEVEALLVMQAAYSRLQDLGWRDATYAPKDGTYFDAIFVGSTGIGNTTYLGDWPSGSFFTAEGGDLWPGEPSLFRLKAS